MLRHLPMFAVWGLLIAAPAAAQVQPSAEIADILAARVDTQKRATGMVVGIIEPDGRRIVAHGSFGTDGEHPVDGDTLFEIGSIAKTFTGLLLAEAVQRGEVALDDPVAAHLPDGVEVPKRDGQQITLLDLAMQTSGLPRLPSNLAPADPEDPYADYQAETLYAFLSDYELPREIGAKFEYSNLGYGLLGHALAQAAGQDYGALLDERILTPLRLEDTGIELDDAQQARMAMGHDRFLRPAPNWHWQVLAGAGALRSTANDLLDFLAAAMGLAETPLAPAFELALQPRPLSGAEDAEIGLGWLLRKAGEDDLIAWHNGLTGGYHAFIGFRRDTGVGVVVLSNAGVPLGDDLGMHLLDPAVPLEPPPEGPAQVAVELPPEKLEAYVGTYEMAPDVSMTVFRDDGKLMAQLTGQVAGEIVPLGEHRFGHAQVAAEIQFSVDETGRATGLVLHQNGRELPAERVE